LKVFADHMKLLGLVINGRDMVVGHEVSTSPISRLLLRPLHGCLFSMLPFYYFDDG